MNEGPNDMMNEPCECGDPECLTCRAQLGGEYLGRPLVESDDLPDIDLSPLEDDGTREPDQFPMEPRDVMLDLRDLRQAGSAPAGRDQLFRFRARRVRIVEGEFATPDADASDRFFAAG